MTLVATRCPQCGHDPADPIVFGFDHVWCPPGPFTELGDALHDAARLAIALDACNGLIVLRVPRGEEGRRDLVYLSSYVEMAHGRHEAERELQVWRDCVAVPLVIEMPNPPASEIEADDQLTDPSEVEDGDDGPEFEPEPIEGAPV